MSDNELLSDYSYANKRRTKKQNIIAIIICISIFIIIGVFFGLVIHYKLIGGSPYVNQSDPYYNESYGRDLLQDFPDRSIF